MKLQEINHAVVLQVIKFNPVDLVRIAVSRTNEPSLHLFRRCWIFEMMVGSS